MRLTKYEPSENSMFPYKLKDEELSTELDSVQKLGQLEDIEERLSKYKDVGIYGLIDLFKSLTDEDIECIVQLAFKKRKIVYEINRPFRKR